MNAATCVNKQKEEASAGDLSVCINCGEMLQFNDILVLKPMPIELLAELEDGPRKLLTKASELIRQRGRFQ